MAGSIDTNPDALRGMARELRLADAAIDGCIKKIRAALNASHWNDNVRRDFERNLENITKLARQMAMASEESQKMLNRKVAQLEEYLRH
jgi:uncharacterized protein YukE